MALSTAHSSCDCGGILIESVDEVSRIVSAISPDVPADERDSRHISGDVQRRLEQVWNQVDGDEDADPLHG